LRGICTAGLEDLLAGFRQIVNSRASRADNREDGIGILLMICRGETHLLQLEPRLPA